MTEAWGGLMSPTEFSDCIGAIYDCTLDPDLWPRALERIGGLMHGVSGVIMMLETPPGGDHSPTSMRLNRTWNVDLASAIEFERDFSDDNPLPAYFSTFDVDDPHNVSLVMDVGEWESSRVYREFGVPRGYGDSIGVYLMKSPRRAASLSIATALEHGYCGPRELAIMRLIAPHARRALAISNLVDMQSIVADGARSVLDLLAPGVILLDAEGCVLFANRTILDGSHKHFLMLGQNDRIDLHDRRTDAAIRQMLRSESDEDQGRTFAVSGTTGAQIFIHAVRIDEDNQRARISPAARLALFVSPSANGETLSQDAWSEGFGLTSTEIMVLQRLVSGMTPEAVANSMGIGLATVRTHLSRLYSKTGTERQIELVRMANMLEAPILQQR